MSDELVSVVIRPKAYLVGVQTARQDAIEEFLKDENLDGKWQSDAEHGGECLVEVAGRLCYMSFAKPRPGGVSAYIDHILEVGHGSVLEHAVYSLILTGVSRSLTHELVRHRAGVSPSQLSQRFVDESRGVYVLPPALRAGKYAFDLMMTSQLSKGEYEAEMKEFGIDPDEADAYAEWTTAVEACQKAYQRISEALYRTRFKNIEDKTLRRKRAREAARSVLPNATETKIYLTMNGRALRHFLEVRSDEHADQEIREVALAVYAAVLPVAPHVLGDYAKTPQGQLVTKNIKV